MNARSRGWFFVGSVTLVAVVALAVATIYLQEGETEISVSGFVAMALGIVLTFAVGAGLMFLVFLNARRGHDDDIG